MVSYVSVLTAISMLNICADWFAVDTSFGNEMGSYYKEHWIMIFSLENGPPLFHS